MKVEGRLGGKFLLRNYLKRILSASEQQDTRGVVWGGERRGLTANENRVSFWGDENVLILTL